MSEQELKHQLLINQLKNTYSPDNDLRRQAENQLEQFTIRPSSYNTLINLIETTKSQENKLVASTFLKVQMHKILNDYMSPLGKQISFFEQLIAKCLVKDQIMNDPKISEIFWSIFDTIFSSKNCKK